MSEYVSLSSIIESPLAKIKEELRSLGIFKEINEGDQIYQGTDPWAMVIPGPDNISLEGNQQLRHRITLYVNFLQATGEKTGSSLPALRKKVYPAFNKLMEDLTHDSTCQICLPLSWHPGFYSWEDLVFLGVQSVWIIENWQTFPLASKLGTAYTDMKDVVEKLVSEVKDELSNVEGIDDVSEGESPYPGEGTVAWVIPGRSAIAQYQYQRLDHTMTLYQNLLSSSGSMTFAEMRRIGEACYDAMMADISHDGNCQYCLPRMWHPGILEYPEVSFVGVMSTWEARMLQNYVPA